MRNPRSKQHLAGERQPEDKQFAVLAPLVPVLFCEIVRELNGRSLDVYEHRWPETVAAIRLRTLTGWRRGAATSHEVMPGEKLPPVGRLPGYRRYETASGYADLADAYLVEARRGGGMRSGASLHGP